MKNPVLIESDLIHLVDVRERDEFNSGHCAGSTNIPLSGIPDLLCALPPRDCPEPQKVIVIGSCLSQAQKAAESISQAKYNVVKCVSIDDMICDSKEPSKRLWRHSPALERVIDIVEKELKEHKLPFDVLDVGCGSGRDVVYLGTRGWKGLACDNNDRLLPCAEKLADLEGIDKESLRTLFVDLDGKGALQELQKHSFESDGMFSLVHGCRYLDRRMFFTEDELDEAEDKESIPSLLKLVRKGGFVVWMTFTFPCTKPSKEKHVLKKDELKTLCDKLGWKIHEHGEIVLGDGRPVQYICAQRPF